MYELAISELEKAVSLSGGDPYYKGSLGHVYAMSRNAIQARKVLQDLRDRSRRQYIPAYAIALVYAGLGDNDPAIRWLEKAYEDRSTAMVFLESDPELSSLRSDPRFELLSQHINRGQPLSAAALR
jgi:tetratricopeptide (TPR) repeat protein